MAITDMKTKHTWNFFRAGGFDQVKIETGADMLALKELDQKLWVALSCPARGIEFDSRTLELIDVDADGHVRANEVLSAIAWAGGLLKNADLLVSGSGELALSDIDESSEEGARVLRSARHVLKNLGRMDAEKISMSDMSDIENLLAHQKYNGDGVVCASQVDDAVLRSILEDIVRCAGSVPDMSGDSGIDQGIADTYFAQIAAYTDWYAKGEGDAAILLLAGNTQGAADAFHAVRSKIDDYFTRCQLAAFDPRAAAPLSRSVEDYQQMAVQSLSPESVEVANFPLSSIAANKPLSLVAGINPAWQERVDALSEKVIKPLLGELNELGAHDWMALCRRFTAFDAWQAQKPACCAESLGLDRLRETSLYKAQIDGLIVQDKAVEAEVSAIHSVERLLRYQRDLFSLVNNFVSFRNFYTGREKGIFQVGTLYLDGRSCELVVRVEDVAKHAGYATMSGVCLVYCDCVRGSEKMSIAAGFTAGDSDYLMVGRNGIFYDRKGGDWDATIVRIIDHPIGIRQAFWSPYKKLSKVISEQLQKIATAKASSAESGMIKAVVENGRAVAAAPTAAKPAFDVGKFAGIFAAIGLAIGAIGGILASIVGGILGLKFWQIPLALAGLMLAISGPSMVLAWFKLKRRNLAPILDANGWAVNARARINIPFGTSLTSLASLPEGANRSLFDPFAEKKTVWPYYVLILAAILALAALWYFGFFGHDRVV